MTRRLQRLGPWLGALAWLAVFIWSLQGLGLSWSRIVAGMQTFAVIGRQLLRPAWAYAPAVVGQLVQTLQIAWLGALLAAILALPAGLLAAVNISGPVARVVGKPMLSIVRAFPVLLLGVLVLRVVGPGPAAGVLTLGLHALGSLGKLTAERFEAAASGPAASMRATGASTVQVVWHGMLPEVLPELLAYALFRFEINMRAAVVLGFVGAGGIGAPLLFRLRDRDWAEAGMILLGLVGAVLLVDALSGWLRRRLT